MLGEVAQFVPLIFLTVLAVWRPTWLKGVFFLPAAGDSLVVGLTWRQTFPGPAGLGTSIILIGFSFVLVGCFLKVLLSKRPSENVEDVEDEAGD